MDRRTMLSVSGIAAVGGLAGCLSSASQTDSESGIVTLSLDEESVDAAVQRITESIEADDNIILVGQLDHAAAATSTGVELPPMVVLFVGVPAAVSPLIQESLTAGLDLPQRMLVWDDEGTVQVAYHDVDYLASRHGIEEQDELETIRDALDTVIPENAD